jgi:hypothetical protein
VGNLVKIIQITVGHWELNGKRNFSVMGLGEDSQIYRWTKTEGKWELFKNPEWYKKPKKQKEQKVDEPPF